MSKPVNIANDVGRACRRMIAAAFASVTACGASGDTAPEVSQPPVVNPPPAAAVASVRLNYPRALVAKGQPLTLVATPLDAAGNEVAGKTVTWSTSNSSVVAVTQTGSITPVAAGSATITAASDGKSATSAVTVIAFTAIQPGPRNTCAIATGGQLYCAGGDYGGLAKPEGGSLRFVSLTSHGEPPNSTRTRICGLTTSNDAYCWGANDAGELGTGEKVAATAPKLVAGGFKFKQISAGRYHTCALNLAGTAYCWGDGSRGQLGNGGAGSTVPAPVSGTLTFTQISAGKDYTCALTADGSAYCWGSNNIGELGAGRTDDLIDAPTPVAGGLHFSAISAKLNATCGVATAGEVYCWGDNSILQLGATSTETCDFQKPCARRPIAVATTLRFTDVAASQFAMCATTAAMQVYCWGGNMQDMFGAPSPPPTCNVSGFMYGCTLQPTAASTGFARVVGSHRNYCGIRDDGIAYCWGGNDLGQLGYPKIGTTRVPLPFGVDPAGSP